MPSLPLFSNDSDLVLRYQVGQGLFWSIAAIKSTLSILLRILGAYCDGAAGFTCHGIHIFCNGQEVLLPFAHNVREDVDKIALSWIFEGSSFDSIRYRVLT